jgi:hypothetical protein
MNTRLNLLLLLSLLTNLLIAQKYTGEVQNKDYVYVDYLRSVQLNVTGVPLSEPIIKLGPGATLTLTFDDLDADVKDYFYSIVHCDRNWQPSNLQEMEYLDGFNEERINDFEFSAKTLWPYTHYRLELPNRDMRWKLSGNYLLLVYDESNDRKLVITRRFVVVEDQVNILPKFQRPNQVSKLRTHQEIDFQVVHKDLKIRNPMQEIWATVMQNGRWDNAVTNVRPKFIRPDLMIFDHQDKIVFPGGKEFRFADLRSLRRVAFDIASVQQIEDTYVVEMKVDQPRHQLAYTTFEDINGQFIIETKDQNLGTDRMADLARDQVFAEYAEVSFALEAAQRPGYEIYLFGEFTDWRPQEQYRMIYDDALGAYTGWAILKQGYYDYMYAAVPIVTNNRTSDKNPQPEFSVFEGNSDETLNDYTILIYYRPFGSRYDMVVGSVSFSSALGAD